MKGRKPTPTALRIARGNPRQHALPKKEPKITARLPDPPTWLTKAAGLHYRQLGAVCTWLTAADADTFAAYCQTLDRLAKLERRAAREKPKAYTDRKLLVSIKETQLALSKFGSDLGIPAAHRTKVQAPERAAGDELDDYAASKGA